MAERIRKKNNPEGRGRVEKRDCENTDKLIEKERKREKVKVIEHFWI